MAGTGSLPQWARREWTRDLQRRDRAEAVADDLAGRLARLLDIGTTASQAWGGWLPEEFDAASEALARHAASCEQRRTP